MIVLVGGATADVSASDPSRVGVFVRPGQGIVRSLLRARVWAADNAAFTGFKEAPFRSMLRSIRGIPGCRFVACPDVVGDWRATIDLFGPWADEIRAHDLPVALVAQDGISEADVPWGAIDAIFIGGSTDWKLSRSADTILDAAKRRGLWRHVGRVNSRRRVRHFADRCDSFDGSGFSKFPRHIKGRAERWIRKYTENPQFRYDNANGQSQT